MLKGKALEFLGRGPHKAPAYSQKHIYSNNDDPKTQNGRKNKKQTQVFFLSWTTSKKCGRGREGKRAK